MVAIKNFKIIAIGLSRVYTLNAQIINIVCVCVGVWVCGCVGVWGGGDLFPYYK